MLMDMASRDKQGEMQIIKISDTKHYIKSSYIYIHVTLLTCVQTHCIRNKYSCDVNNSVY